jgi:hypothetical protein
MGGAILGDDGLLMKKLGSDLGPSFRVSGCEGEPTGWAGVR